MSREFDLQTIKNRFGIIGNSPKLNYAIQVAMQVAPTDMTVLIHGESGVGKESFSKIIHSLSARKHGQFIAVNCGAIPSGTIDSELFGHEKGSFTGATSDRKGYFEVTDGGTIFLDEIAEMPLETQSRLLRVLENGEFIRVGASKVQKTNVRVVAASNKNLLDEVKKGRFREDLYYRLATVPLSIPPLRERENDIYLLFRKFSSDYSEKYRVKPIQLTDQAIELLQRYHFPGNIRQLKNISEQVSILEVNRTIDADALKKYLPKDSKNMLPTIFEGLNGSNSINERDILYKFLFEMKHDLNELKKIVFESLSNENYGNQIIQKHDKLFDSMESASAIVSFPKQPNNFIDEEVIIDDEVHNTFEINEIDNNEKFDEHEEINENLSLEDMEKKMIIKALEKNQNRRKNAASELGISERTLYRKLKYYNIDQ